MTAAHGSIFISYRREDTRHIAGRLADTLAATFGSDSVFMDVESIEPGLDFADAIDKEVARCDVLIALIGPTWTSAPDSRGRRRIDDKDDFVSLELEAALRRDIRVIPVLVDGAGMPSREELPPELQPLARRNAVRLDHESYRTDTGTLLEALARVLAATGSRKPASAALPAGARDPRSGEGASQARPGASTPGSEPSGTATASPVRAADRRSPSERRPGRRPSLVQSLLLAAGAGLLAAVLITVLPLLQGEGGRTPADPSGGSTPSSTDATDPSPDATGSPSDEPDREVIACWDGTRAVAPRSCPMPRGRAGVASVFPSMSEVCRLEPAPVVVGKAEVYLCLYEGFLVRYTRWKPGPGRVTYYDSANPGSTKANWVPGGQYAGPQWTSFEASAPESRRYQWSATYVGHPFSVSVEGASAAARALGIDLVTAVRPDRVGRRN